MHAVTITAMALSFNLVPSQAVRHRVRRGASGIWRFFGRIHGHCIVSTLLRLEVDMFNYFVDYSNATADLISDSMICNKHIEM